MSTISGGGEPAGYVLVRHGQQIGGRFPTREAAQRAAEGAQTDAK